MANRNPTESIRFLSSVSGPPSLAVLFVCCRIRVAIRGKKKPDRKHSFLSPFSAAVLAAHIRFKMKNFLFLRFALLGFFAESQNCGLFCCGQGF